MSKLSRWGGPAAIVGGVLWALALSHQLLGELEYQGELRDNPIPDAIGMMAMTSAAVATGIALLALGSWLGRGGITAKVGSLLAYAGAAVSLIPLWPATFLGPVLLAVGLVLIALAGRSRDGSMIRGCAVHAYGFPAVVVVTPLLAFLGINGIVGLGLFAAVMSAGLIWIGIEMNARDEATSVPAGAIA